MSSPPLLSRVQHHLVPEPGDPVGCVRCARERWDRCRLERDGFGRRCLLAVVDAGRGELTTPSGRHPFAARYRLLLPARCWHVVTVIRPITLRLVVCTGSAFVADCARYLDPRGGAWPGESDQELSSLVDQIYRFADAGGPRAPGICSRLAAALPLVAATGHPARTPPDGAASTVAAAKRHLEAHFAEGVGIGDAARACHCDRSVLARAFRRVTGETPSAWLERLRLGRAAEHLARGDATVAAVATACGYRDAFVFSKAFKRRYGVAPSRWRDLT